MVLLSVLPKHSRVQIGSRVLSAGYKLRVTDLKRLNRSHWQILCLFLPLADITFILYLLMSLGRQWGECSRSTGHSGSSSLPQCLVGAEATVLYIILPKWGQEQRVYQNEALVLYGAAQEYSPAGFIYLVGAERV